MLSKPHSMMLGQAEVNSILLPWKFSWSYTVIWNGERAAELGTARQHPQVIQHLLGSRCVWARASGGCTGHPSGLGRITRLRTSLRCWPRRALPWCPGSRTPAPAPLSCSPLRRSVPGAAVPSGERSGALLGRVVAGGSPGLCSERSRAKRINGGNGEGELPWGAAADALLSRHSSGFQWGAPHLRTCFSSPFQLPPQTVSLKLLPDPSGLVPALLRCAHHPVCSPRACLPCLLCLHRPGRADTSVWLSGML